jgi:hypothetical protein
VPSFVYVRHIGVREFDEAVAFLGRHPEVIDVLVTHRFSSLSEAPKGHRVGSCRCAAGGWDPCRRARIALLPRRRPGAVAGAERVQDFQPPPTRRQRGNVEEAQ